MRDIPVYLVKYIILVLFSFIAIYTDYRYGKIYNWLNFSVLLIGLIVSISQRSVLSAVLGIVIGFVLMFPFFASGGMGAGDVKFAMATGALVGARLLLLTFAGAGILIFVYAMIKKMGVLKLMGKGFKDLIRIIKTGFKYILTGLKLSVISGGLHVPSNVQEGGQKDVMRKEHKIRYGVFLGFSNILIGLYLIIEQGGIK